jgi:hypothetical protein
MKKTFLLTAIIPAVLLMTGCDTTGLSVREQHNSYAAMINSVYRETPNGATNKPLTRPMRLAVAQIGEVAPDTSLVAALGKDPALVREVIPVPMPGDTVGNYGYNYADGKANTPENLSAQVQSARNLSRDSGAEYLLLVGGSIDSFDTENVLAVFDLTIVGGYLVPASKIHMNGKAAAALVDVESGRVVFMVNSQLRQSKSTPDFFSTQKRNEMSVEMREQILKVLAGDVLEKAGRQPSEQAAIR